MEALFSRAASTVTVNITIDGLDDLDALEVCFHVIDLFLHVFAKNNIRLH